MFSTIKGIGLYFPAKVYTNSDLQSDFPTLKVKELTRLTGVESRHICEKNETSVDMGFKAAEDLFSQKIINKDEVEYLIFCSAGGDYITPASACVVHELLGLNENCGTVDINQGCTGFLHGFNLANGLITSGSASNVLLITSEAISKTVHSKDKGNRAIFGDAAAATLISSTENRKVLSKFIFGTDGSKFDQIIIKYGRERYPIEDFIGEDFIDEMGAQRNDSKIYMNGSEVFNFSINKAPDLIDKLLKNANLQIDDIDMFVFHQSNRILLETLGKKLNIPEEKIVFELENNGNTVSSSIPIALKNSEKNNLLKRGHIILTAGFGVGFSWGGCIFEY